MRPEAPRDAYSGPESGPEPPYPLKLSGPVIKGFGRGSKDLGIPTANIPIAGLTVAGHDDLPSGVYFGFAGLEDTPESKSESNSNSKSATNPSSNPSAPSFTGPRHGKVHPMVMSMGYNPFYKNTARSVEVHIMHDFARDFYGAQLKLLILGFIRPEYDYVSRDALVEDIRTDIEVAGRSLEREAWKSFAGEEWLVRFDHEVVGTGEMGGAEAEG